MLPDTGGDGVTGLTGEQSEFLSHWEYDASTRKLKSNRAIETTLNSLYLGEQHKMSSGAENIFFTNLGNETNFYPMWGGLKDQSITANRDSTGLQHSLLFRWLWHTVVHIPSFPYSLELSILRH